MSAAPLRIGIQGLGVAGSLMAEACAAHPGVKLAGGVDPNESLARRFGETFDTVAHSSADAMLADAQVDAIYIATPHQLHAEHAVAAANAGKHIIVEKPMALSLADCDAMIAAAEANSVQIIVGHTHGFDPTVAAMRQKIASDEVGPFISALTFNFTDFLYRPRRPEELDTAQGGGIIFNQLPHQIDVLRTLSGAGIECVRASAAVLDRDRPTEGFCTAFIQFEGGATATLSYSGYDRFDSDEWHAWTAENGAEKQATHGATRATLHNRDELDARRAGRAFSAQAPTKPHPPHFGALLVTCRDADLRATPAGFAIYDAKGARDVKIPPTSPWPGHAAVLDELIAAIGGGVSLHDGAFGRDTLAVCLAILKSSQTCAEVRIADIRSLPC
jgi:phthalate 4,5-cis-dihydrodiol dehydrogenase